MFLQPISPAVIRTCRMYGVPEALAPICRNLTKTGIKKLGRAYKDYTAQCGADLTRADASNRGGTVMRILRDYRKK